MQLGGFFGTKNNAKYSPYSLERPTTQVSFQVPSETPSQASLAFSSSGLRAPLLCGHRKSTREVTAAHGMVWHLSNQIQRPCRCMVLKVIAGLVTPRLGKLLPAYGLYMIPGSSLCSPALPSCLFLPLAPPSAMYRYTKSPPEVHSRACPDSQASGDKWGAMLLLQRARRPCSDGSPRRKMQEQN